MSLRLAFTLFFLSAGATLASPDNTSVKVTGAWVRATVPGQPVAGAYMEITSAKAATLVKVETPIASVAEIHSMKMENGVMRMQAMALLPLPANKTVRLSPGGDHLMLMGLKRQVRPGEKAPIRLTVKNDAGREQTILVDFEIKEETR
jgi:periplasmic copper chaperone A